MAWVRLTMVTRSYILQHWSTCLLRGLKQTLCAPGPRDPTETEPELCLSVSCEVTDQQWPAPGSEALSAASAWVGPFKGGCHYLHYLHHSSASGQTTGREHSTAHQQNLIKDLLSMAHQNRTQFPPQSVSPIRKLP